MLEIGCGEGNLLAALKPAFGIGVDLSIGMVKRSRNKHPNLMIIQGDAHALPLNKGEGFDYIILSDLLNDVWDVQAVLEETARLSHSQTRVIINSYSRLWELPLAFAQKIGMAKPNLPQNWLTTDDIRDLLALADLEIIKTWPEIIFPMCIPLVTNILNRFVGKVAPFKHFALTNFIVARPTESVFKDDQSATVSIIVPARNEEGNISEIFTRLPRMGGKTELIFVEGHSKDNTYEVIEKNIDEHPEWLAHLYKQSGAGKGDAVRLGFDKAEGDILMILDADLTVSPEDLGRFYNALSSGKGELINGVRLVYPMEDEAMRFFNLLGNKFFSLIFSWLLGQPIKDVLCGTKVISKANYEMIAANRQYFGDFDPFGDFDLIFGATKQNLKIIDLPVRYQSRKYGSTNIHRWRHGWLLTKMVVIAAWKIKFI